MRIAGLTTEQTLLAAATGGVSAYFSMQQNQAKAEAKAIERAERQAVAQGVRNQNALVEKAFSKRKTAGLGDGFGLGGMESPLGNQASQTGAVLTSVTGNSSILG